MIPRLLGLSRSAFSRRFLEATLGFSRAYNRVYRVYRAYGVFGGLTRLRGWRLGFMGFSKRVRLAREGCLWHVHNVSSMSI